MERVVLPLRVRHVSGPGHVRCTPHEAIVVCLAKNGAYHLDAFIGHYRRLGVKHVFLLDNGSTDDTVARAARHPLVSVFETDVPFRGNNRQMRRYLVRRFCGRDRWVLVVDIDELFDYPHSDRVDLASLLRYLRERSFTAMAAYQLDMLPDGPLDDVDAGLPLETACRWYDTAAVRKIGYFDPDSYRGDRWVAHNSLSNPAIKRYVGGIRAQAFDLSDVYLIKHPLMRRDGRTELVHQHFVDFASVADVTGVLRHYKFVPGFRAKVDAAVRAGSYAHDSWEYRQYQRVLDRHPSLTLKTPTARELRSIDDLLADGFVHTSDAFQQWAERPQP